MSISNITGVRVGWGRGRRRSACSVLALIEKETNFINFNFPGEARAEGPVQ